jgi:Zn-dependent protease
MGGSFKIGRLLGIDVKVHWTFFLLLAFFAFIDYQTSGSPVGALTATAVIVALSLCVLLHEFGLGVPMLMHAAAFRVSAGLLTRLAPPDVQRRRK